MNILSNFAEILGDLLLQHEMKASQLASAINVQTSSVTRYLRAERIPTVESLVRIADYFNCSTDYLLGLEEVSNNSTYKECPSFKQQVEFLKEYFKCTDSYFYKNTDLSKTRYYDWKKGKCAPTLESVVKLATLFDCSIDFILGREKA